MATEIRNERENVHLLALQWTGLLGAMQIQQLLARFETAEGIWQAAASELNEVLSRKKTEKFLAVKKKIHPEDLPHILEIKGMGYVPFWDEAYPPLLKESYNYPAGLFYKGHWFSPQRPIGIVGTRHGTAYGRNVARYFAEVLAEEQVTVVSGGARGIDGKAHEGALAGQGRTIAVMGCGLDVIYPPEHKNLFERIAETGLLLSEYPPETQPLAQHFPVRNRIIAGLCRGIVVVEAAAKSGSLITADLALSEGRDVFAVPGSVLSKHADGVHWLLRQGAIPLIRPEDILGEYGWFDKKEGSHKGSSVLSFTVEESNIINQLSSDESNSLEKLVLTTRLPLGVLHTNLVKLEMKGVVANLGQQQYILLPRR